MTRWIGTALCVFGAVLAALIAAPARDAPAKNASAKDAHFFVAPDGNDRWSGTKAAASRDDGPFATVARAQAAARQLRPTLKPGQRINVQLRGGRYQLAQPLHFGPEDSGLIVAAFPGETPVLSGGRKIDNWMSTADGRWRAELADVKEGAWGIRRLVVNGLACERPRLPRTGFFQVAGFASIDQKKYNTPSDRFEFKRGDLRGDWKNLRDVECVVLHFWVDTHLKIAEVDEAKSVVTFDRSSRRRFSDDYRGKGARYYVDNVSEALAPGQFYLDRRAGTLHYLPRPGEDPAKVEAIAPRLDKLVVFEGDPARQRYVEDIELRGLTLADSAWEPPAQEAVDAQAASVVPGAVVMIGARRCAFTGCTLRHLGSYAIELREGCRDNRLLGNHIAHCGAGGIRLSGGAAGSAEHLRTSNNVITDNHLHHLGAIFHSGVGILSMHSADNTLAHNHIHHLFYTGISAGWVWGYGPSVSKGNTITHNHIHDVGQGLLSDMGGVYLLGSAPGTVVRNNLIHDVDSWSYGGWGIYTDEGSTGVTIENNVVYKTKSGGFHQHYGKDNVVRNNILALARTEQIARSRKEAHRSFTFERNIVYFREGLLLGKNWDGDGFALDHNLYYSAAGGPIAFPGGDFASWQARGHDRHSRIADPRFVNPESGNFTLAPDSPALQMGFVPIDLSQVGPRPNKETR